MCDRRFFLALPETSPGQNPYILLSTAMPAACAALPVALSVLRALARSLCFSVVFAYFLLIPHIHILTGILQNCAGIMPRNAVFFTNCV
jgi:hypothetical protein